MVDLQLTFSCWLLTPVFWLTDIPITNSRINQLLISCKADGGYPAFGRQARCALNNEV